MFLLLFWFFLVILGFVFLIKGGDFLVDGASSLALRYKVKPLVIGLTVVAFGTSAPEFVVSALGAFQGNTSIALSNIVGSNIANILLILAISAILYPVFVSHNTVWKEIPMSFLAAFILAVLSMQTWIDSWDLSLISLTTVDVVGHLTFSHGLVMLSFFIIFMYYTFGLASDTQTQLFSIPHRRLSVCLLYILVGLFALGLGSKLVVDNSVFIARAFGVSDMLIGLTIVALGTSLPELATSIVASLKRKNDIVIGNIVGSNIFNIFFTLGVTSLIRPIPLTGQGVFDILFLLFVTIFLFVSLFVFEKHRVSYIEGSSMLFLYFVYLVYIFLREF